MKRRKPKIKVSPIDSNNLLEIYPKTKAVYDYIKEHPNTDAREIASAFGERQVYTHVNRLEDHMLVSVQTQREKHYTVKHYTAIGSTNMQTCKPQQQEAEFQKTVQTRKKEMSHNDYKEIFEECLFDDLNEDISRPNFRFNIGGVDCVSSGSIVAVTGKPGVGKSTTMAIIAGVLIGGGNYGMMQCKTPVKNILWIDTEKDAFSCKQRMKTLRCVAGLDVNKTLSEQGVKFLTMKPRTIEERISLLEEIARNNLSSLIYDAVFIDGIFDLTDDPGNLQKVARVMELLKSLSGSGATVFGMLHTNKQDDNMREVLGTEFQRICTNRFLINYDKVKKIHNIIHDKSNDTRLAPTVSFQIDEADTVVPVDLPITDQKPTTNENFKKVFEEILADGLILSYKELIEGVIKIAGVKRDMAKKRIANGYNKGNGYLMKDDDGRYWLKNESGVTV
ncbi:MAG: ATP-binding protein [Bacteroidales bacterium]|nr:ATP-binding protein [Bacteroidales bacterium]